MSLDELWSLHEHIGNLLSARIISEKRELEHRLVQLNRGKTSHETAVGEPGPGASSPRQRRAYPRVLPKYRNPAEPAETWSGRGKQPRWLVFALKAGGKIEDFVIPEVAKEARGRR